MSDSWDDRQQAQENRYFEKANKEALERLNIRSKAAERACPVDGKTLEQSSMAGVIVDRCPSCQGIWLDSGELEEILKQAHTYPDNEGGALAYIKHLFS